MFKLARLGGVSFSAGLVLSTAANVFAGVATPSGGVGGGSSSSLPNAGSTGLTYLIFVGGVLLFIWGVLKLALSYRSSK